MDERTNREVFLDLMREVTGFEHGLARTIIDLRKKPDVVLQQYLSREGRYVSPFRLLLASLGIWLFVNSYLIDWYRIWNDIFSQQFNFLFDHVFNVPAEKKVKIIPEMEKFGKIYSTFVGDIFSKYYVPFVVVVLPISSFFAAKFCRPFKTSFRSILVSNTYAVAVSTLTFFLLSVAFAVNVWIAASIIMILFVLLLTGRNYVQLVPLRRFYPENGLEIEKRIIRGNFLAVMIVLTAVGTCYFLIAYMLQ